MPLLCVFENKFISLVFCTSLYLKVKKLDTDKRKSDKRWSEILTNVLGCLVKVSYYKC